MLLEAEALEGGADLDFHAGGNVDFRELFLHGRDDVGDAHRLHVLATLRLAEADVDHLSDAVNTLIGKVGLLDGPCLFIGEPPAQTALFHLFHQLCIELQ